jgi:hypothetical protein
VKGFVNSLKGNYSGTLKLFRLKNCANPHQVVTTKAKTVYMQHSKSISSAVCLYNCTDPNSSKKTIAWTLLLKK